MYKEYSRKIRRNNLCFLWSSKKSKDSIPLVKWNTLEKPKKEGGCGINNIFLSGHALEAKRL
jgi:hypothetical protein